MRNFNAACRARNEGNNEELIALIIANMQDPVTPILEAVLVGEGLHARVA